MAKQAIQVAVCQRANQIKIEDSACEIKIQLERKLLENSIKSPNTVYGPYNYMRSFSAAARNTELINKKFYGTWKHINKTTGYNGAHHLISKATIKKIYKELKAEGKEVSLQEMENNAPAIFHPLHGDPKYKDIFHNIDEQYEDYKKFGMKVAIISVLAKIDSINIQTYMKRYPEWYLKGILKEAELWCKYYGIKWE